jgi:uncharacterized membrane protein YbhN (UPF0104 family)
MSTNSEKLDTVVEIRSLGFYTCKAIQIAVGIGLVWWMVAWFNIDGKRFVQAFRQASFMPLVLAMLCFAFSILLKSRQYLFVFSASLPKGYITGIILSQNALLTFLPWRMGELALPFLLRRDLHIPVAKSMASLIAIRGVDLSIVIIVGLILGRRLGFQMNLTQLGLVIGVALILLSLLGIVSRRLRGQTLLWEAAGAAVKCLRSPVRFSCLLLFSIGIFCLSTLQSMLTLQGFGLSISLYQIAWLNALTLLLALIPIHPPGGWGTMDSIQIATLHYFNYPAEDSAPIILAAHCFYTVLISLGGMLGWILRGKGLKR